MLLMSGIPSTALRERLLSSGTPLTTLRERLLLSRQPLTRSLSINPFSSLSVVEGRGADCKNTPRFNKPLPEAQPPSVKTQIRAKQSPKNEKVHKPAQETNSQKPYTRYKARAEFTVQLRDGLGRMNQPLNRLPIGCLLRSNFVAYAVVWSSSPNANNSNNAWNVNFNNGNDNTNNKNNNKQLRLVRSGEWHE